MTLENISNQLSCKCHYCIKPRIIKSFCSIECRDNICFCHKPISLSTTQNTFHILPVSLAQS